MVDQKAWSSSIKPTAFILLMGVIFGIALPSASNAQGPRFAGDASSTGGVCTTPRSYVKLIDEHKYDAVGGLFADDAVYLGPDGKTRRGASDIGKFYARFLPILKPELRAANYFEQGDQCILELENKDKKTGEYTETAVDIFTIDRAGKVAKFVVYLRPGAQGTNALRSALKAQ
ncbi:MAG TPA: nuclear transport factor 2 family protein [Candidatus Binataceae bacterium]|nr:nuclear transport factor 2 family protein [Candidatus Binataceae bacterium]